MAACFFFLCSAIYPSSGVFWDDWLGAHEFKLQLHVVAFSSEERDISVDHMMLLTCFFPKMIARILFPADVGLNSYVVEASVACGLQKEAAAGHLF